MIMDNDGLIAQYMDPMAITCLPPQGAVLLLSSHPL
jgi:hypothetical protein